MNREWEGEKIEREKIRVWESKKEKEREKSGRVEFFWREKLYFFFVLEWLGKDKRILLISGVISAKVLMSKQNGPIGVQD